MQKYAFYVVVLLGIILTFVDDASASHSQKMTKKTEYDISTQVTSYLIPTTDPNTVYNHYVQTGGREMRTKDSYFAHCQVWVQTTISKSFVNGAPRINPDNTYYPGDAFAYSFSYGWDGSKGCRNLRVCPVESNLGGATAKCDHEKLKPIQNIITTPWSASMRGIGEISTDDISGHFIQLTIAAERYFCVYPKKSKMICGWSGISATGIYLPNVLKPKTTLTITQEYLKDTDGFVSGNLDETYYLWDAINLVHTPSYKWKQERLGTITVLITKKYDLNLEKEFQCESAACTNTVSLQGFEPWHRAYQYGGGTTLMNATTNNEIKKHRIHYTLELLNLGRPIHKQENTTNVLVVQYGPAYDNYPYLVLKDGHAYSWGNRPAVALYYHGSYGGGQDDLLGIHEKRRSKINSFDYRGYAYDPIVKRPLDESLVWTESSDVVPPKKTMCTGIDTDSGSFEGGKKNTAMFVKKGYGKIVFGYPILHTMLAKRFVNATIDNTLQSSDFAGNEIKNLTTYKYQYPDVKFGNPVKVLTYGSDGKRTDLPVSVTMSPDKERGAQYTHDYVCNKVLRDTKRGGFAEIVVNDMYDKTNQQNGTGYATLKSKLTSTWFPGPYLAFAPDVMNLELSVGYGAPSPYEITMTAGEKTRTIKRIVNFLSPFTHIVNLDADNSLNVTNEHGLLRIHPDEKFGDIVRVSVNGNDLGKGCMGGCTITAAAEDLKIEAWNLWGGHAVARINNPEAPRGDVSYDWNLGIIAVFVAIIGWLLHGLARQALNYFRNIGL